MSWSTNDYRYLTPMELHFAKWHGTGNDFIVVDDRMGFFPAEEKVVRRMCDRHFGIGSDGLILIQASRQAGTDFHMEFFNPDASRSFCGNGSRCAFAAWSRMNGDASVATFTATDGVHRGTWHNGEVAITLRDVGAVHRRAELVDQIDNGSPHELVWVADPAAVDIMQEGPRRRYAPEHAPGGTNVNFLAVRDGAVWMRTYERGVEAETLSCGTGVVAAALSALARGQVQAPVRVHAPGGSLVVEAQRTAAGGYQGVRLLGPVAHVFQGTIDL
ncbi:MAG: diaminopimelate epimerase [Flavobacteriales bacterium]|jgi:diaminopimelate epimerase|nr:MAG: diaminopimelate epimerase [Flavobacteriales bacterium]